MSPTLDRLPAPDRVGLATDIADRRRRLLEHMAHDDIDILVVASEGNCQYLTGYESTFWTNLSKPFAVVLAPTCRPIVVCHAGEAPSVELDAIDVDVRAYGAPTVAKNRDEVQVNYQLPAADALIDVLGDLPGTRVGLELSWHFMPSLTPEAYDRVRASLTEEIDASYAIWRARRVKSAWEVDRLRTAADVTARAHDTFAKLAKVGMTERELGRLARAAAYEHGADKIGYSGIMAGIDRAPLGGPTDRPWERGQLLFVDICVQVTGYFSDYNRIHANTTPTTAQRDAYSAVTEVTYAAEELTRPGTPIDEISQVMIGGAPSPYARVGHGVGLEMPEPPSLSPDDPTPLFLGEVICLEPNRFVDGVGWVVAEETVAVTANGPEFVSPRWPTEMLVIG